MGVNTPMSHNEYNAYFISTFSAAIECHYVWNFSNNSYLFVDILVFEGKYLGVKRLLP